MVNVMNRLTRRLLLRAAPAAAASFGLIPLAACEQATDNTASNPTSLP
jgi:hypothetical protein